MITERKSEDRKVNLSIEEAKVKAITTAVHAAAGNRKGMEQAQQWSLTAPAKDPTTRHRTNDAAKVWKFFGGDPLYSPEEIRAAAAARKGDA